MDDRHFYDPRHRPPPPPPPQTTTSSARQGSAASVGRHSGGESPPAPVHYRDHPAYHRQGTSHRAWEEDHAPPPLPMLSGNGIAREQSHHLGSSSHHPSRPGPPPHHYDYEHRRAMYEEERLRDYEERRAYRDEYEDHDRHSDSRSWSSSRPQVRPSYRREYYSPPADRERSYHAALAMEERESAPPKAAMSISSLLDSGSAASVPPPIAPEQSVHHAGQQRYASPPYKEEYDGRRDYHSSHSQSRSRMYSESVSPPIEQRRAGASISDLLDDGDSRRPVLETTKVDALAPPDARFSLSHLSSPEPKHASRKGLDDVHTGSLMIVDDANTIASHDDSINGALDPVHAASTTTTANTNSTTSTGRKSGGKLKLRSQPLPKSKKKFEEEWDSDLSAEENRPVWSGQMEAYNEELMDRLQCIEQAFLRNMVEKTKVVGKRLSHGYRLRYEPVMTRVRNREENERKQREARQKQRKEASRKQREKEVEMELLDTLDDTASTNRPKSNKSKAKPNRGGKPISEDVEDDARTKKRKIAGDDSIIERLLDEEESLLESRASSPESFSDDDTPLALASGLNTALSAEKRDQQLIEAHRRIWIGLARKDIPKVYRTVQASATNKAMYWRRVSSVVAREAKRGAARSNRSTKDVQVRARKVMREMLVFWKRNEKEERELRKKAEKEALC